MDDSLKSKIDNYKVPKNVGQLINDTKVAFMVGISAAGKDTIRTRLLSTGKYHHIVSHTTRPPRHNHGVLEQDGVDYHFIDYATLEKMLDNGGFVEAKLFSGNVYGTSVAEIQMAHDEGKIAITDIEVQGVAEYKIISDKVVPIFLLPPSFEIWQKRLLGRYEDGAIDQADLKKRMHTAKVELQEALDKPYFEYVVNNNLETAIKVVDEIAHGNFSDKKNQQSKKVARELLSNLDSLVI